MAEQQRRKPVETSDLALGNPSDKILSDGTIKADGQYVDALDAPLIDTHLEALAFMEEVIAVQVHESTDENAENPISVGVNGVFAYFFRGQPTLAKRKFVDGLCVKNASVTTPEYLNPKGERAFKIVQKSAFKYPFAVLRDDNPKGKEWLTRRLAEAI